MTAATILWTPAKLKQFKDEISEAEVQGTEVIKFEGHDMLVRYGKWLIKYLDTRFSPAPVRTNA